MTAAERLAAVEKRIRDIEARNEKLYLIFDAVNVVRQQQFATGKR